MPNMAQTLGRLFGWAHKYSFRRARADFDREEPSASVVRIRNLKSSRDDGILFPGDKLNDVADDREQIIADFEENFSSISQFNCGDGTSNSSVCTGSPDLFSVEVSSHDSVQYAHSDVEITDDSTPCGITPLQVRRGSEPALNSLCPTSPTTDPSKRWSTAVVINPECQEKQKNVPEDNKPSSKDTLVVNGDSKPTRNFSRSSGRLSILGNSSETYRWIEAADRQLMKDLGDKLSLEPSTTNRSEKDGASDSSSVSEEREQSIILRNESGPLGIHVLPDYDSTGRDTGLVIQGIEAGGRIDRDGRFRVGDRIVEINGQSLRSISFQVAQEVFKDALKAPQIKLELLRGSPRTDSKTAAIPRKPPPPVYPKLVQSTEGKRPEEEGSSLVEGEERAGGIITKVATVTPTKKMPTGTKYNLAAANTRRIGKKIAIQLTKGGSGLGFSVTTRDNPTGGNSPIYIKNVLPKGAAIEDGRLKPGDRLLEVNDIEMSGMNQSEAVGILRNVPLGGVVNLVVSRQEVESSPNPEPETVSQTSSKAEEEAGIFPWKHREILTFQIPMNGAGKTGLGVHIIGKSTSASSGSADLGIFIKAIIPGGAASKDGRLQARDQLVNINGISLLGIANNLAMDTLRNAMSQMDGPIPNTIILTVARRINQPPDDEPDNTSIHSKVSNSQGSVFSNSSDRREDTRRHLPSNGSEHFESYNGTLTSPLKDLANVQKLDSHPPGSNPIIDRLTGRTMNDHFKKIPSDSFMFNMTNHSIESRNSNNPSRNEYALPMYSPTICVPSSESVMIDGEYNSTVHHPKSSVSSDSALYQHNNGGNILREGGVIPASSQLSLDDMNDAFTRDGFGRQSMSEKRHAQLNAKNTDTYQRNKKVREERERSQQQEDSPEQHKTLSSHGKSDSHLTAISPESPTEEPRGPSLGLRKSSSLESLQTMIQELNKDDEAMKKAAQSSNGRGGSRSRGCNESFRAAVDRSYEAPAPATMETLDEESESGSSVSHILGRAAEFPELNEPGITRDPFSENAINLYCRSSKNSKKKSLLKGLGSVFKFGKTRKGKFTEDTGHDSEHVPAHLIHTLPNREQDRMSEQDQKILSDVPKKPLPSVPRESSSSSMSEPITNRQERMQNLREQHQRLHQIRQGHYPLEHKEEFYESEIQAKEGQFQPNVDVIHMRSHSHDEILGSSSSKSGTRLIPSEPGRYSHYMNYKEIQQQMTQYYQGPKLPFAQNSTNYVSKSALHQPERPNSNFFEYESVQQLHRHATKQLSETDTSSLPRSAHLAEHSVPHMHAQNSKHFYNQDYSGGYERRNIYHYYPNNNNNNGLYSHVVPGSKV